MPFTSGPQIKPKSPTEMTDATNFFTSYKSLYYGSSDVSGDSEMILMLLAFKNYLTALYGLGLTSPASGSAITGSYFFGFSPTGSTAAAGSLITNGYI